MKDKPLKDQVEELCKKYSLHYKVQCEIMELVKSAYVKGINHALEKTINGKIKIDNACQK